MKYKLRLLIFGCLLFRYGSVVVYAQEVVPTAGGIAIGNGGTASYTIGQIAFQSNTGANGIINQGVQQPYEILIKTIERIKESSLELKDNVKIKGINFECVAYPNPTSGFLELRVEGSLFENMNYQLFDIYGNLLLHSTLSGKVTSIHIEDLKYGTYILKVNFNQKKIKTFKIIKK